MYRVLYETFYEGKSIGKSMTVEEFNSAEEAKDYAVKNLLPHGGLSFSWKVYKVPTLKEVLEIAKAV